MSMSRLFTQLGAPLNNVRNSWGAIRKRDSSVFLKAWQDETQVHHGKRYIYVLDLSPSDNMRKSPGYAERKEHVDKIREGASAFIVMCRAKDVDATPRVIASYNRGEIFVGGELYETNNKVWLSLEGRKNVSELTR